VKTPLIGLLFLAHSLLSNEPLKKLENRSGDYRLNGGPMNHLLCEIFKDNFQHNVSLFRNEKLIANGIIVDSRGFLLTKASSSVGARFVKSDANETFPIRIRKRDEATDLALWKITSDQKWKVVDWASEPISMDLGTWVISVDGPEQKFNLGVISASSRPIGRQGGEMGILFEETNATSNGIEIVDVLPHTAGDRAGLQVMDRILKIDGNRVKSTNQINKILQAKDPGELLVLVILRRDKELIIRVTLGHRSVAFDLFNRNLLMSGPVSKRKDNFPFIIQHDLPLEERAMGGGLYGLDRSCLGLNIARIDRVTTYTLPAVVILPILKKWLAEIPSP
jgi:serine protease Do